MGPLCHVPGVLGRQGCETGDELVDRGRLGCRQDLRAGMSRGSRRVCGSGLQGEVWAEARVWASVVIGTVPTSPAGPSGEQVKPAAARGATGTEEGEAGRGGPEIGCAGERSLWKKCDRCCVMVVARQRGQSSRGGGGSGFRGAGDARGDLEGRAAGRSRRLGPGEGAEPPPRQRGPPEGRRGGPPPLVHASIPTFHLFRERSTLKTRKSRSFRPLAGRGAGGTHLPRMKAM